MDLTQISRKLLHTRPFASAHWISTGDTKSDLPRKSWIIVELWASGRTAWNHKPSIYVYCIYSRKSCRYTVGVKRPKAAVSQESCVTADGPCAGR